jgi:hypothetical protein
MLVGVGDCDGNNVPLSGSETNSDFKLMIHPNYAVRSASIWRDTQSQRRERGELDHHHVAYHKMLRLFPSEDPKMRLRTKQARRI